MIATPDSYRRLDSLLRVRADRRRLAREGAHNRDDRYRRVAEAGEKALSLVELVQRLALAGAPMTVREIAEDMGLTARSVQRYIRTIRDLTTLDLVEDEDDNGYARYRIRGLVRMEGHGND